MRVLLALGGNAMTNADGRARPEDQIAAAQVAMAAVADLLRHEVEVVITHGNGPQVGNLLVKNELAASVVPPVPLDWCGAQTQATIGFVLLDALEPALAARGLSRPAAALVTRTLVDGDDPGFRDPTKPVGRYLPLDHVQAYFWLSLAANRGHAVARTMLAQAGREFTADEITQAEQRLRDWKPVR